MWIEIAVGETVTDGETSPSVRKVWIEITDICKALGFKRSPSVRKVWIEIHNRVGK